MIYKNNRTAIWLLSIGMFLSGCTYVAKKAGYENKQAVELRIEEVKKQKDVETTKKLHEIETAKDGFLKQVQSNFEKSTENVYGAKLASDLVPNKDRLDILIDYKLQTALSFSPPISTKTMLEQNDLLKKELDETQTSLEQLKQQYNVKREEALAARNAENIANKLIEQKNKELYALEVQKNKELEELQKSLNDANNQIIADSTEKELEKKEESKRRMWLVSLFGFAALATGAGAIFSPIFKKELGFAAAVSIGLSIAAAVVPVWVVTVIFVGGALIVATPALLKAIKENKIASQTYVALENVKTKEKGIFDKIIKPELIDAHGEYSKDGKVIQSKNTKDFIDKRLIEIQAK